MGGDTEKARVKFLEKIGDIEVWEVDGAYIRTEINPDFTNFGQHLQFKFIPSNEFWLDKEKRPDERIFFIHHLLVEHRLMQAGASHEEAIEKADKVEMRERSKILHIEKAEPHERAGGDILKKIHMRKWDEYGGKNITVWIVDGAVVRTAYFPDFTEGGHDLVFKFIPDGEVWIDNDLLPKERPYVLLHEVVERQKMAEGMGYVKAHYDFALKAEYEARHHPETLERRLKDYLT